MEKKGGFAPGMLNQLSAKSLHGIDKDSFGDYQHGHHNIQAHQMQILESQDRDSRDSTPMRDALMDPRKPSHIDTKFDQNRRVERDE